MIDWEVKLPPLQVLYIYNSIRILRRKYLISYFLVSQYKSVNLSLYQYYMRFKQFACSEVKFFFFWVLFYFIWTSKEMEVIHNYHETGQQ